MRQVTKFQKALAYGTALGSVLAVSPLSALGYNGNVTLNVPGQFTNVATFTLAGFIQSAINILLVLVGLVAFFWLLIGGVQWIMAGGDKEGTEKARKRITSALIGLVIVFSVFAFVKILSAIFGVDLLNFNVNVNLNA